MQVERIRATPPRMLDERRREFYFDNGYLALESYVPEEWLARLRQATEEMVERSAALDASDLTFDLEPGHTRDAPRLRRLSSPLEHHPIYLEFATAPVILDLIADLVGPDVTFHHSKLNFKWAGGGEEVKWHQDIQFWPHTNYSPLTLGVCLNDVGPEQAPLGVVPGSHKGELFDQYNDKGEWAGCLAAADLDRAGVANAVYLGGPAGTVTLHNCRTIHGSKPNLSDAGRPLLLHTYASADALPYTCNPLPSRLAGKVVRGKPARWADHDPRPCQMPPDWSGGYTSLFALQQDESWSDEQRDAIARQTDEIRVNG